MKIKDIEDAHPHRDFEILSAAVTLGEHVELPDEPMSDFPPDESARHLGG